MSTIECPYCEQDIHEPEECTEPGINYEEECPKCGKTFQFQVDYTKDFYPKQADCLNGAPHDYQPIRGSSPDWYFKGKRRCSMCSDQIEVEPPVVPPLGEA